MWWIIIKTIIYNNQFLIGSQENSEFSSGISSKQINNDKHKLELEDMWLSIQRYRNVVRNSQESLCVLLAVYLVVLCACKTSLYYTGVFYL